MIGRHLAKCEARITADASAAKSKKKGRSARLTHLVVETPYISPYWLHIEISSNAHLRYLDQFLRDIWLECCGHLSAFKVGNTSYVVFEEAMTDTSYMDKFFDDMAASFGMANVNSDTLSLLRPRIVEKTMASAKIADVFQPNINVSYEYDFGSTTELRLRYVSTRTGIAHGYKVQLLARNEAPVIPCEICGEPATLICKMCRWDGVWLCAKHAPEHECGDEYMLPVVNSPRAGVCAYGT
ncbi:MAG: hypothetical protein KJ065_09810 [Anaerolineae bacterium]|nr:hypothetical protein [Anaerolineae bacterium]